MLNFDWVKKIQLEVVDEEDGGMNLIFTWDEKAPELQLWTELGEEKRSEFILRALENSCALTPEKDLG